MQSDSAITCISCTQTFLRMTFFACDTHFVCQFYGLFLNKSQKIVIEIWYKQFRIIKLQTEKKPLSKKYACDFPQLLFFAHLHNYLNIQVCPSFLPSILFLSIPVHVTFPNFQFMQPYWTMRRDESETHILQYQTGKTKPHILKLNSVFYYLPSVVPRQFCALANLGCTHEAVTLQ